MTREKIMMLDQKQEKEMKRNETKRIKEQPPEKEYKLLDDVIAILEDDDIKSKVLKKNKLKKEFINYLMKSYQNN